MLKTIIIVNDTDYINGGASKVALSGAFSLAKKNCEIIYFTGTDEADRDKWDMRIRFCTTGQSEIVRQKRKSNAFIQGLWNIKAQKLFKKLLVRHSPENCVIHVHSWTKVLSASVISIAVRRGYKVVLTLHDYFTICPNGGFYHYKKNKICAYKPLSARCLFSNCDSRSYSYKVWRIIRQYIQRVAGGIPHKIKYYISISGFSENILKPYLPIQSKIFRVNNPIDILKQEPVEVSSNTVCAYIGRLSLEKGVLAFARVSAELSIKPLFIGAGPCDHAIRELCPEANMVGWVDPVEISRLLRTARFIVFPSLWYETQGLVVLEAASLGVPAIVAKNTAASEYVRNGYNGYLYDSNDNIDLREKMSILLRSDSQVKMMGTNAYNEYWKNPDLIEKHADDLMRCYNNIIEDA